MTDIKIYNQSGKEIKSATLSVQVFGVEVKPALVAEVAVALSANQRQPLAHTKGRSEVRGGGRKPWKQKGTGRARHGSIRSPLWIGGGVTFGPTNNQNFTKKINKKVKAQAIRMVLTDRAKQNNLIIFDDLKFSDIKTKAVADWLQIKPLANKKVLLVLERFDKNIDRSARNLPQVQVTTLDSLNLLSLLAYPYLVMTESTLEKLVKKYSNSI